jgi:hypothetical protein
VPIRKFERIMVLPRFVLILKVTPAMAAGVTEKPWEMSDMVKVFGRLGRYTN